MARPVPAALSKLGIREIRDNLGPDQVPDWTPAFVRIFRPELEERFNSRKGAGACVKVAEGNAPSISE